MTARGKISKLSINQAAVRVKLTPQYIRSLIRLDRIKSTLEPITPGSTVTRHMIDVEELMHYLEHGQARTRRTDKRHKWVMYATFEEMAAAKTALIGAGLGELAELIRTANALKIQPVEEQ